MGLQALNRWERISLYPGGILDGAMPREPHRSTGQGLRCPTDGTGKIRFSKNTATGVYKGIFRGKKFLDRLYLPQVVDAGVPLASMKDVAARAIII